MNIHEGNATACEDTFARREKDALCQSEQPDMGMPSGVLGALTFIVHFSLELSVVRSPNPQI